MTKTSEEIADIVLYKLGGVGLAILDGMYRGRRAGLAGILGGAALGGGVGVAGAKILKKKKDKLKELSSVAGKSPRTYKR